MARRSLDLTTAVAFLIPLALGCSGVGSTGAGDSSTTGAGGIRNTGSGSAGTAGPTSIPGGTGTAGAGIGSVTGSAGGPGTAGAGIGSVTGSAGGGAGVGGAPPSNTGRPIRPRGDQSLRHHRPRSVVDVRRRRRHRQLRHLPARREPRACCRSPPACGWRSTSTTSTTTTRRPPRPTPHPFRSRWPPRPTCSTASTTLLRVGIQAHEPAALREAPGQRGVPGRRLGQHGRAPDKLPLVQAGAARDRSTSSSPTDTISIVTYRRRHRRAAGADAGRDKAPRSPPIIDSLAAGGSTAGARRPDARLRPGAAPASSRAASTTSCCAPTATSTSGRPAPRSCWRSSSEKRRPASR